MSKSPQTWSKLASREGVDLVLISSIDILFYEIIWDYTKKKEEDFFTYFYDKSFTHYIHVDAFELGRYICQRDFDSIEKIKGYYKQGKKLWEETSAKTAALRDDSQKEYTAEALLAALAQFRRDFYIVNKMFSITPWLAIEAWQREYEAVVSRLIKKAPASIEQDALISALYKPWRPTAVAEMQDDLKCGLSVEEIVKKYQFLRSWSVVWYRPIDENWVRDNMVASGLSTAGLSAEEIIRQLKPNEEEERFIRLAPYIIFFKDWRDDLRRFFVYRWNPLFEKIADLFHVTYNNMGYLTVDEIENGLMEGSVNKEKIDRRKIHSCVVTATVPDIQMRTVEGEELRDYQTIINEVIGQDVSVEIKGQVAQAGKARGKVVLVHTYHDIKKIKEGDILVANTTHPNYLPGMQKAVAFVTNEGGIISHAAIVAREMKKPCIVGAKAATRLLKDGDLVEVDADKGVVRIIQRDKVSV